MTKQNPNIIERMPPQNIEAEQSLLSCILIDENAITKVVDTISSEDFYRDVHSVIYATIVELYNKSEAIDILTLSNRLKSINKLEMIGGRTYLAQLSSFVATASNVQNYATIIQHKATLRRLQKVASEISQLSYDEETDVDEILDKTEMKILGVSQKYSKNVFFPIESLLTDAFERIDDLHKQGGKLRGLSSGFPDLDKILGGFQKSDLIILAARPSVGKTALALDLARQVALKSKVGVGVFSLEMSKEQLVDRMLCAQSDVSLWKMRTGKLSDQDGDDDFSKIAEGMSILSEASVYIDDQASASIMDLKAKARRLQVEKGLGLIIIDYLQLMEGRGKYGENRVQEISEISRGLKGIARELNIPVLALSQLSRAVEQTKPAIPKLSHLRDSGSIEQDADVVMFIYRKAADRNYEIEDLTDDEKHIAQIYVAKHRNGPTGKVDLYFDEKTVGYKNLELHAEDEVPNF